MTDIMDKTSYGQIAMRKFGAVSAGFHVFSAEWLGEKPEDWKTMRVSGAQFVGNRRVPRTTMTTILTVEEIRAEERAQSTPQPRRPAPDGKEGEQHERN